MRIIHMYFYKTLKMDKNEDIKNGGVFFPKFFSQGNTTRLYYPVCAGSTT